MLSITPSVSGMNHFLHLRPTLPLGNQPLAQRLKAANLGCELYGQRCVGEQGSYLLMGHALLTVEALVEPLQRLRTVLLSSL